MVRMSMDTLRGAPLSEVAAEFAGTKPIVHVVCNPSVENYVRVATDLANTFRNWGIEATTISQFVAEGGREGDIMGKIKAEAKKTDIFIQVLSVDGVTKKNEGIHVAMMDAATNDPVGLPAGKTRIFSVVSTDVEVDAVVRASRQNYGNGIGVWNEDPGTQKRLLMGLLIVGPQSRKAEL